jgi:hypothetical protein
MVNIDIKLSRANSKSGDADIGLLVKIVMNGMDFNAFILELDIQALTSLGFRR